MSTVKKSDRCIICRGKKLIKYLSLGKSALANSYLTKEKLNKPELKVPLEVYYCENCHLAQLLDIVDRKLLFSEYAYFSSTSPQLLQHFDQYAQAVSERFPAQTKKLVLEIASNDGILLKGFMARGARVLGIDPARNIARVANKEGVETIPEFFGTTLAPKVLAKYGKAGVVTANNVLAHTDDVHDIVAGVKQLLDEQGVFVFQVKYLGDLLAKNEFDTTYHEHISYFSLLPLTFLLRKHAMEVFDVEHVETEGGSLRVYAAHSPSPFPINTSVGEFLERERADGLDRPETYLKFAKQPQMVKEKLREMLKDLKQQGKKIAGYGASAKGNALLQYCGIGSETINYITDTAPSKQGKYTPGTHIPIVPPERLREETPDYILLLAWNYAPSILKKEEQFRKGGGKFIIPIPKPHVV
jgi:SAM-dependent methyltransferase